jgi:uncharacterized protein
MGDFDYAILSQRAHRPWAMPAGPWVMTQTWNDLLFAHWRVDAAALRAIVPPAFPLDTFVPEGGHSRSRGREQAAKCECPPSGGEAWISVVPFHMTNVGPRFVPSLPWVSAFPELNVRTYVRVADKPGVYFFSLDAASSAAVAAARSLLRLPYYTADMLVTPGESIEYRSRRIVGGARAAFEARYRPIGPPSAPVPGSLAHFLTERYCLYALGHFGRPYRLEIHHPPWPLQTASAEISVNTMTMPIGMELAGAPLLHFAKRQDVVCWTPEVIDR